ncbi:MAG: alpha/beta hydrolase-fold protein, partial [Acidimicrobiaceae bacterium]|nr:alpha/beta hydrolase-fold protein [Acidimicrobiaceae bacterium]
MDQDIGIGDEPFKCALAALSGLLPGPVIELPMWRVGAEDGPVPHRFRGPDAPAEVPSHPDGELRSLTRTHTLDSTSLRTRRTVTVYLPPSHCPAERLPVLYATDGAMIDPYSRAYAPRQVRARHGVFHRHAA